MVFVLKNFNEVEQTGEYVDVCLQVKISDTKEVYTDLPYAPISVDDLARHQVFAEPIYVFNGHLVTAELLDVVYKDTKKFAFKVLDQGELKEVDPSKADVFSRLPEDTDVANLRYLQGEVVMLDV